MTVPSDLLDLYFADLGRVPLLSREEEVELAQRIEAGRDAQRQLDAGATDPALTAAVRDGDAAFEQFATANLRLVVAIAARYHRRTHLELADLIQEGNLGLHRALEKFDWRRGYKLSTYASWWIRQSIQRGVAASEDTIRMSYALHEASVRVRAAASRLEAETGQAPTAEQLAEATKLTPKRVREAIAGRIRTVSLDQQVGDDHDADTLAALIAVADDHPDEEAISRAAARELRLAARRCLDERARLIVALRFGLTDDRPLSTGQIADTIGRSRETVRLVLKAALDTLRHELRDAA